MSVICSKCGLAVPEGALLCPDCGEPVPEIVSADLPEEEMPAAENAAEQEKAPPKKRDMFRPVSLVAAVVCFALLCLLANALVPDIFLRYPPQGDVFVQSGEKGYIVEGSGDITALRGEDVRHVTSADSGRIWGYIADMPEASGAFWLCRDGEYLLVDTGVQGFVLAEDGSAAYAKTPRADDAPYPVCELYLLEGKSRKMQKISPNAVCYSGEDIAWASISPDGGSVAYIEPAPQDETALRIWSEGEKSGDLGKNMLPLALSNGARRLLYAKWDGRDADWLHLVGLWTPNKNELLGELEPASGSVALYCRKDLAQIVFSTQDGAFFREDGWPSERISEKKLAYASYPIEYAQRSLWQEKLCIVDAPDMRQGALVDTSGLLLGFDDSNKPDKLALDVRAAMTAGKNIFYAAPRGLYVYDTGSALGLAERIAPNALLWSASYNGRQGIYLDAEGKLYSYDKGGASEIAADVSDAQMHPKTQDIAYISAQDGQLHYQGKAFGDAVHWILLRENDCLYLQQDGALRRALPDGTEKLLLSGLSSSSMVMEGGGHS